MELSIKTCEDARFEIEKNTPKDNIVSSILSYIDKAKNPQNDERETIKTSLSDTLSYNIKLDTGKEINLKESIKDADLKNEKSILIQTIEKNMSANIGREIDIEKQIKTKEYSQINIEKEKTDFSERLEKTKTESKDLLDIKDRDERQKTVLNATVRELSQRINPISKTENTNEIKEDLKNKYELSKKEDSKIERDPVKHVYRTMNAAELKQLFDGRDVVNVAGYEKLHFFPDTLDYESRANSLFGIRSDEYDWDVKDKIGVVFEVRDDDFYNNISGAYYTVSDESSFDSVKMDPHFDIKLQDMYGSVDVITPEYQVMSYNIGQLMPISIDGKDITDMKIQDILNDLKGNTYSPIDVEDKYVGTGLTIDNLEKMPSMGEAYINWCNEQGIEPEFY